MMTQNVLSFKLEITEEKITANAGLAVFGEFVHATGILQEVDRVLKGPGSGAGYKPSQYVEPLMLMLQGGGRALEDLRVIKNDLALCELMGIEEIPSSDALGDWLRRQGKEEGLSGLAVVRQLAIRRALNLETTTDYTLDIDATQIVAEKEDAKRTYKGERGYMPIVGHLAENGLIIGEEFRQGNDAPAARNLEFIKYCAGQMPAGKRIAKLRSDSAAYQADIINWCEKDSKAPVLFAIGADLDAGVRAVIDAISPEEWSPYQDGHIAERVHCMNRTKKAFRLIVIRRPAQLDLLTGEEKRSERYTVIASNRKESAQETVAWYNRRGDASENRIKDLKIGFGMERMPCGDFAANAMFFRLGTIAYNMFVLFKMLALSAKWRNVQVQTLRWRLYHVAGKVVRHGRRLILKVSAWMHEQLAEIRVRSRELACAT
jgi:Transposase DDE domain group 1